jgi:GrpB-like predicted nucleotidyltransferase (UPF0157 family)
MKVHVAPYDPSWPTEFTAEAECVRAALAGVAVAVHHIGSTAIPGIFAKPIIDILLEVDDIQTLDAFSSALAELGYEAKGEFGIPGRRYFRKESTEGVRTHQIHAFEKGSAASERHLAFRDYMIAQPAIAHSYSLLKQHLATSHPDDIEAYMDGKDSFIKENEEKAIIWRKKAQQSGGSEPRDSAAGSMRS